MPISQTPAYNLKVVLKETGIAADTLRAWERRYGLPKPQRTPGGHRLYSQHDIQLIKWLMARQAEGFSISRAVDLWLELSASGGNPLSGMRTETAKAEGVPAVSASLEALRRDWLEACMAFNSVEAEQALNQAFALYPVEQVVMEVLQAGLHEMGEGWYLGRASVQQEHFASALATRRLETLISAAPAPARSETLLLTCPPDEQHAFPLLLLSLLLSRRGWKVVYLGPDVPIAQLDETLQAVHPGLVILAAQGLASAESLRKSAEFLAGLGVPVAYGGRIFNEIPDLRGLIPGHFLAENIQEVPGRIELLLKHEEKAQIPKPAPDSPLARAYQWNQPLIEASVRRQLNGSFTEDGDLDMAVHFLTKTLLAALKLGGLNYLNHDLSWLKGLSRGKANLADSLRHYLTVYSASIRDVMGADGEPIAGWLDAYAART